MKVLLTRDQEATLWNFQQTITAPSGTYLYSPYYMKDLGGGEYERLRFDQLPEDVKDALLKNQGIKLPDDKPESALDWLRKQEGYNMRTSYLYDIVYKGIQCAGLLSIKAYEEEIQIRPKISTDDIGEGAGCGVIKRFKRN